MLRFGLITLFVLSFLSDGAYSASKQTFAEKYRLSKNQMFQPQRVTVGPEDNYQSQRFGSRIYYTKGIRLSKRIFVQDIETGRNEPFVDDTADSKEPAISPDGKYMAFTFFKYDAKGDICILKLKGGAADCITDSGGREMSPFWLGSEKLAYMVKDPDRDEADIYSYDMKTKKRALMFSGRVLNPRASATGKMLVYIKVPRDLKRNQTDYRIVIRDVGTGKEYSRPMALPGIPSFPVFDASDEYVYFGHFTNDTSGDMVIDSDDRAIIFRVKVSDMKASDSSEVFPEPLSSLEHNCNFPDPQNDSLFITCAFNESLDIYSLPVDGVIPPGWGMDKLDEAHRTSRSYEDRILTLMYMASLSGSLRGKVYYEKLLSNYYAVGERNSSRYTVAKLLALAVNDEEKRFYSLMDDLLRIEIAFEDENPNLLTDRFSGIVRQKLKELSGMQNLPPLNRAWSTVVSGALNYMLGKHRKAKRTLNSEGPKKIDIQFIQYVRSQYLERIFLIRRNLDELAGLYSDMASMQILDEASKVFYSYRLLETMDDMRPAKRSQYLGDINTRLSFYAPSPLKTMLKAEELLDKLSKASGKEKIQEIYEDLFKILDSNKDNYYLKRALFVRSIRRLSKGNLWRYMYYVANYWLSATDKDAVEYSYARDQYLYTSLDKAYGLYSEDKYSFAGDEFYVAMRLTDDLEAHHGFIYSKEKASKRKEIDEKYDYLYEKSYTYENIFYKRAYFLKGSEIEKAINLLEKIDESKDRSGVKNLLLGYLYYKKLGFIKRTNRIKATADRAYRNLMLAADLGRYNIRVRAQALMNLGLLQQKIGNFGASLAHFEERKQMPFLSKDRYVYFLWFYARAFYHQKNSPEALKLFEEAIGLIEKEKLKIPKYPFIEKAAFYSLASQDYKRAKDYYSEIINNAKINKDGKNSIKTRIAYAYALYKLGDLDRAKKGFHEVYEMSKRAKFERDAVKGPFLKPQVYTIQSLGYLANMQSDDAKRAALRQERLKLLMNAKGSTHEYGYNEESWMRLAIKEMNNLAYCYYRLNRGSQAMDTMDRAIPYLEDLYESSLNPIEDAYLLTLQNYMSLYLTLSKQKPLKAKHGKKVSEMIEESLKTFNSIDEPIYRERAEKMGRLKKAYLTALPH